MVRAEQFMCWTLFISNIVSASLPTFAGPLQVLTVRVEPPSSSKSAFEAAKFLHLLLRSYLRHADCLISGSTPLAKQSPVFLNG